MLLKDTDDKTPDLDCLQELFDRPGLSARQRDDIFKQLDNIRTGYRGEKDAAYFLNDAFGDSENTILIHDLRLEHGSRVAQIDHLLINRFRRAYVLETKSFNGNLTCNEKGQWAAWYGSGKQGKPFPIESPVEQVRRHCSVLDAWFKANGLTRMERIDPVVIVSPKTYVSRKRVRGDEGIPVIAADLFHRWWLNERDNGGENVIGLLWRMTSMFSAADLRKIGELLVSNHRPQTWDWEARFGIRPAAAKPPAELSSPASVEPIDAPAQPAAVVIEPASATAPAAASTSPIVIAPETRQQDDGSLSTPKPIDIEASAVPPAAIPSEIETAFGLVTVKRVSNGVYALRHGDNAGLADHVRQAAQLHGRWQPRFQNWLVPKEHLRKTLSDLQDTLP